MTQDFHRFDVIVIGGGSVGMLASHRLAPTGARPRTAGQVVPTLRSCAMDGGPEVAEAMRGRRRMWSNR